MTTPAEPQAADEARKLAPATAESDTPIADGTSSADAGEKKWDVKDTKARRDRDIPEDGKGKWAQQGPQDRDRDRNGRNGNHRGRGNQRGRGNYRGNGNQNNRTSRAGRQQPGAELLFSKAAKLLTRQLSNGGGPSDVNSIRSSRSNRSVDDPPADEKRRARRLRRERRKDRLLAQAEHGEDGALMYEMEEGGMRGGSDTGDSSERDDSDDLDRKGFLMSQGPKGKRGWDCWVQVLIYSVVIVGFALVVLGVWKISIRSKAGRTTAAVHLASNGTALFAPTTIIISLDGFRADFLQRGLTPRLNAFIQEGVSPKYMLPSFPSVTFPNHYTLATGLYPESHGIVGNSFWDPVLQKDFYYTDAARSLGSEWWKGEPFWVTAELQGIRTAIHMWPGSEANILDTEPSFVDKFNGKEPLPNKVSRIFEFLDMPGLEDPTINAKTTRPQIIAAYVPNVDSDGHKYGPNSTEIRATINDADTMLDAVFQGLEARNLTQIVNVIVVSDHGMATTDTTRLLQIEDLINMDEIERDDGWPLYGLRPKNESNTQALYDQLAEKSKTNPNFEVYLRDVNMPERYHFSNNDRIAPLWIVPKTGWAIVKKEEMVVADALKKGEVYHPRGLHGYDHEHPLMRAIFVARGPAFPHPPNSQMENFQNTNVYNILCDSVGITPKPNNGTLRLPLKTVGFHEPGSHPEVPEDPVPPNTVTSSSTMAMLASTPSPAAAATQDTGDAADVGVNTAGEAITANPSPSPSQPIAADPAPASGEDGESDKDEDAKEEAELEKIESTIEGFWEWITSQAEDLWGKIAGDRAGEAAGHGSR